MQGVTYKRHEFKPDTTVLLNKQRMKSFLHPEQRQENLANCSHCLEAKLVKLEQEKAKRLMDQQVRGGRCVLNPCCSTPFREIYII